jgi:hypothetical protein
MLNKMNLTEDDDNALQEICDLNWTNDMIPEQPHMKFAFQLTHHGRINIRAHR